MPGESPVVALTKSSIPKNRKSPIAEGEFSGANRTNEIRAEDRCEIVMELNRGSGSASQEIQGMLDYDRRAKKW